MLVTDESNGGILGGCTESNEIIMTVDGGGVGEPLLGSATAESETNQTIMQQQHRKEVTLFSEVKACLSSPVLVSLSLVWAAIIGVVASLGTFGGAYAMALDLFDNQRVAATWFGIAAASAGVVGTPLGGRLADRVLARYGGVHDGHDDGSIRHAMNASMLSRVNVLVALALVSIFPTLLMTEAVFFLSFLFIGWTLLCESAFILHVFYNALNKIHVYCLPLTFTRTTVFSYDEYIHKSSCNAISRSSSSSKCMCLSHADLSPIR